MDVHLSAIPWSTRPLWQEANTCLATAIRTHRPALAEAIRQALQISGLLELIYPLMDRLCRRTCPACTDICCQRAWVWVDFKDLMFLHLTGIPAPDQQLLGRENDHCRYADPHGCRLDRIQRPFLCTWYLCPAQTHLLRKRPADMQIIAESLNRIKGLRQRMEVSFMRALA